MSHGLQMQAAYTFSRSYTNTAYDVYNDPNIKRYGAYAYYRPQRLAITYNWDIPFGKHEGLLDKLAGGWNVSGVTIVQDGTPLTLTDTRGGVCLWLWPRIDTNFHRRVCSGNGQRKRGHLGRSRTAVGRRTRRPRLLQQGCFSFDRPPGSRKRRKSDWRMEMPDTGLSLVRASLTSMRRSRRPPRWAASARTRPWYSVRSSSTCSTIHSSTLRAAHSWTSPTQRLGRSPASR